MGNLLPGQVITPFRSRGYQADVASVSFTASTTSSVTVTFPTPFSAAPRVLCQVVSSAASAARSSAVVTSVSTTAMTVRVDLVSSATVTVQLHWQAIEP